MSLLRAFKMPLSQIRASAYRSTLQEDNIILMQLDMGAFALKTAVGTLQVAVSL